MLNHNKGLEFYFCLMCSLLKRKSRLAVLFVLRELKVSSLGLKIKYINTSKTKVKQISRAY